MRRIYRRICLLREQGKSAEAAMLESAEFSRSLAAARIASRSGTEEAQILAAEAERVSTACLLAEMVGPLLAECIREEIRQSSVPVVDPAPAREPARPAPRPAPPRTSASPNITDLIDGMLSLESAR